MPPKWPSNPSERLASALCQVDQVFFVFADEENQEVRFLREAEDL